MSAIIILSVAQTTCLVLLNSTDWLAYKYTNGNNKFSNFLLICRKLKLNFHHRILNINQKCYQRRKLHNVFVLWWVVESYTRHRQLYTLIVIQTKLSVFKINVP